MNTQVTQPTTHELTALGQQGFAYLQSHFHGTVIQPGDAAYDEARHVWNGMIDKYPALIARCANVEDVITAVNFGREHNLVVAVRGGGHNAAGHATCDGGLVIDLSPMRAVQVDPAARLAHVQGGAIWADVDQATQVYGLATPGGLISTTGVAGLTLGGGLSWLRGKYGLSCDNLVAAEVVTADGRLLHVSETENADLLWGLRGGGGNFGIVTTFTFRLHSVGPTLACLLTFYPEDQARAVLAQWRDFMRTAPDEFSSNAFFWAVPSDPSLPAAVHGQRVLAVAGVYAGAVAEGERCFQPLRELGTPILDLTMPLPYVVKQSAVDAFFPAGTLRYYWKSLYLNALSDEVIDTLATLSATRPSSLTMVDLWAMGGAVTRVPAEATAFGDRSAPFWLVFNTTWADPAESERNIEWTRSFWRAMQPFARDGIYMNFPGLNEDGNRLVRASHGVNYERLVAVKKKYDPINFFRLNQNIQPTAAR